MDFHPELAILAGCPSFAEKTQNDSPVTCPKKSENPEATGDTQGHVRFWNVAERKPAVGKVRQVLQNETGMRERQRWRY